MPQQAHHEDLWPAERDNYIGKICSVFCSSHNTLTLHCLTNGPATAFSNACRALPVPLLLTVGLFLIMQLPSIESA